MNDVFIQNSFESFEKSTSMQEFGEVFIEALPKHLESIENAWAIDEG